MSRSLVVAADNNDLRIEEAGIPPLTREETQTFLRVLHEAIADNAAGTVRDGDSPERD